ncbi:MAG: hypothetical protein IPL01_16570 [Acidobacteria bacterium]|nr:hypothetical protein [Acidobacteriota bacterium]
MTIGSTGSMVPATTKSWIPAPSHSQKQPKIRSNSVSTTGGTPPQNLPPVTLSGFTLSSNRSKKHPFGNGSDDDNVFDIKTKGNKCSKVSVDINSSAEEGSYKYTINGTTNSAGRQHTRSGSENRALVLMNV